MHLRQLIGVTSVTIWTFFFSLSYAGCPNPHQIHPCICLRSRSVLTCEDLYNEDEFNTVMQISKSHDIVGVELTSVAIRYLPKNAFEGSNIRFLNITDSSIRALTENSQAFIGLEKSLKILKVENCPFANQWEWAHLTNLTMLEELEVIGSELVELSVDFLGLAELPLVNLKFLDTGLQMIPDYAFSSFKYLNRITLDQNDLTELKRSLLPRPAKKLTTISLNHNRIRFIPDDMFVDMPALKFLYLGSNPLYVMEERIFKPIWKQLHMFSFHGTNLICDCRLSWVTKMKNTKKIIAAQCITPARLRGRRITTLESDELWCSLLFYI